ncbi:MAG: preprotein translocase subunit YajC [Chitinophagaceae bacterium]|nr:preprotein translocase subunit YajC [Chitinophagaceae bacterium]
MNVIMLQGAAAGGGLGFPLMMLAMVVVMYFFMIRPQAKKAKEQKKFAESIVAGEQIVTTAGIHGKIAKDNEDGTLKLEVSNNNFITLDRSAVSMDMTMAHRKKTNPTAVATK